ncbi:hypothetical protein A3K70_02465 [Candidatus Bathyarchaeota archaeon RBG_16_48_13]|nr:MAG: hypothetical protein A3K70_02465 [Candidatus Bathyarchaeota archaeon RBG_16_48_13]
MPLNFRCKGLNLGLGILDMSSIAPHEETRLNILNELSRCIREQGYFSQPVTVDRNSLVVLDGMHRVSALKNLHCLRISACLIDYSDPSIDLAAWYRTFRTPQPIESLIASITELGIDSSSSSRLDDAFNGLKAREITAILASNNKSYTVGSEIKRIDESYDVINLIEEALVAEGCSVRYETEFESMKKLRLGGVDLVLMTPVIKKSEVIGVAKSGRLFSPKATRHIIPARPINIEVPLDLLTDISISVEEADSWLVNHLRNRRPTFTPLRSGFKNKRYDEETCVLED